MPRRQLRSHIEVRTATPDDLPDLTVLWAELRAGHTMSPRLASLADQRGIGDRLAQSVGADDSRVLLAALDGTIVGVTVLTIAPLFALDGGIAVHVDYTFVALPYRRRGVGRALVAAAADVADEIGADHLVVGVSPSAREANRFYAQLGFGALVVRRVAPLSVLRRRLAALEAPTRLRELASGRRPLVAHARVRAALRRATPAASVVPTRPVPALPAVAAAGRPASGRRAGGD